MVTVPNPKKSSSRPEASNADAKQQLDADVPAIKALTMDDEAVERLVKDFTEYAKRNSYDAPSILAKLKDEGIAGRFILDLYRFSNKNFAEMIDNMASEAAISKFWTYAMHPEWQ
ncbi:MAG: hypothetical protein LVQ97_04435 [Candidatus Micrarchaeales archaeon]|jgi:hypothetical protein|uniref:Uncharacterized protein n=1 Tax=Candidatus Micrarchaeum acidiphilum ARMAN-2 TaxID=425595 RepID=C7DH38_MICA2|nr:MAG: hypothetical protein UNLARM2_0384 [Candidatus Micrarchaeum acidiphilum ARMAN-2]MCW6161404.1 hypothetical protein [Candidatus Micrarchaeales archaeon]